MISFDVSRYGIRHLFALLLIASLCLALAIRNSTMATLLGILATVVIIGSVLALLFYSVSDLIDKRETNEKNLVARLFNSLGLASTVGTWLLVVLLVVLIILFAGLMFLDSIAPS